jgi:hypothetical protein
MRRRISEGNGAVFVLSAFIRISFGFRASDFEFKDARICVACPDGANLMPLRYAGGRHGRIE